MHAVVEKTNRSPSDVARRKPIKDTRSNPAKKDRCAEISEQISKYVQNQVYKGGPSAPHIHRKTRKKAGPIVRQQWVISASRRATLMGGNQALRRERGRSATYRPEMTPPRLARWPVEGTDSAAQDHCLKKTRISHTKWGFLARPFDNPPRRRCSRRSLHACRKYRYGEDGKHIQASARKPIHR